MINDVIEAITNPPKLLANIDAKMIKIIKSNPASSYRSFSNFHLIISKLNEVAIPISNASMTYLLR